MPAEVMIRLDAGEDIVFLDTRTTADWAAGTTMIANALRVKNNVVLNRVVRKIPKERLIVTYCT
jgi:rhodanese-related sulfurtransferase